MDIRNNYAFIDSQNLNVSVNRLGWRVDFYKFRIYLKDKYKVSKAFLFIGYIDGNQGLYRHLQEAGFICIFKPTLQYRDGTTKGNVDAELVLHTMIEIENYNKAIIVTGDGDFYCLAKYLLNIGKLEKILIPDQNKYSYLLRDIPSEYIAFISDLKKKLSK